MIRLKKRKIKFAAIYFVCWFALWVLIVDGIIGFQTLLDKVGSYALLESSLILLVLIPTVVVYIKTKKNSDIMEEPILNSHNKAEYEPAHTSESDTWICLGDVLW